MTQKAGKEEGPIHWELAASRVSRLKEPISGQEVERYVKILEGLGEYPQHWEYTPQGLHILAPCYQRRGHQAKTLEVYGRLVNGWPAEKQIRIGSCS